MKNKFSIYLAGPITGLSYTECVDWREYVQSCLSSELICFSPLRAKTYLKDELKLFHSYEETLFSSQRGIFARDMSDCIRCDALFANLLGAKDVSIGTIMEITSFWFQRKPIVLVMEEGNPHEHPMIREACPFRVTSLDEAIHTITSILLPVGH